MDDAGWVDVATFIVAVIALLLSGWAAFSAYRQARVAERATQAAEQSAAAAEEALQTTQKMERYEAARLHAERLPEIDLKHRNLRGADKLVRGIRLINEAPTQYDEWRVQVDLTDPSTARVLVGLIDDDGQVLPEVTVTDVDHGQDVDLEVKRASAESSGEAKFVVIARSGEDEWRVVRRLRFHGPARVFVADTGSSRLPGW